MKNTTEIIISGILLFTGFCLLFLPFSTPAETLSWSFGLTNINNNPRSLATIVLGVFILSIGVFVTIKSTYKWLLKSK